MKREEIRTKVFKIVDHVWKQSKELSEESNINNDLGFDSLDKVECLIIIEKEFDILIKDDVAELFQTLKDVIDYIEKSKKH